MTYQEKELLAKLLLLDLALPCSQGKILVKSISQRPRMPLRLCSCVDDLSNNNTEYVRGNHWLLLSVFGSSMHALLLQ
jgi:hypothetical protein